MAIFKCKMCGGMLEIDSVQSVATCEYCGTKQTLPRLDDERRANLYDRANHFRRNNDFDKAMGIYENILNEDNTDAEAYWSIVLCRYGIEYVEDPTSHRHVPTVNRAQFTSIFDDEDYKSAIANADGYQCEIYEAEAATINEIQKDILTISQKEEPFDVFICYKETDEKGRRTHDSVLATELYHELTREGFKVFFSRITLEDKLGVAYEPYIFAALHSAKVMVVLGTRPEHFNAVWVKNEWSRYLALIKNGAKKTLIPAYRDMDPYDLPDEFSHLQAQDMSKLGFMQDLTRGIKKIVAVDAPKVTIKETIMAPATTPNIVPLLKRAFMFLEDEEFDRADDFCEQVLNQDPENAQAYLGKLMSELQVKRREELANCDEPFDDSNNYRKIMRFGDSELKSEIAGYIEYIKTRDMEELLENQYLSYANSMNSAKTERDYLSIAHCFEAMGDYKESARLSKECLDKAENLKKHNLYNVACIVLNDGRTFGDKNYFIRELEEAIKTFESLQGYQDSNKKIILCKQKIEEVKIQVEQERIENERKEETKKINAEKRARKVIKFATILAIILAVAIALVILCEVVIIPNNKYNKAVALMNIGKYEEAIFTFEKLDGYKDSNNKINACKIAIAEQKYQSALSFIDDNDTIKALQILMTISDYKDSNDLIINLVEQTSKLIYAWGDHTFAITNNGSILLTGANSALFYVNYSDVKEIVLGGHLLFLKSNGKVVGSGSNKYGELNTSEWNDIIKVAVGRQSSIGLRNDGTVVQTGIDRDRDIYAEVDNWKDIVDIAAPTYYTVGLKSDGTVLLAGESTIFPLDVSTWTNVTRLFTDGEELIGLQKNGNVIISGTGVNDNYNVSNWTDIINISTGDWHFVGLRKDGSAVATGNNQKGQCEVQSWKNIVSVCAGETHTVGLKADGTVVAVGMNNYGQCDVGSWTDIIAISAGARHTVGLKSDGTLVTAGSNVDGQCNVNGWNLFD